MVSVGQCALKRPCVAPHWPGFIYSASTFVQFSKSCKSALVRSYSRVQEFVLPWKLKIHYWLHLKFPLDFILDHSLQFTRSKRSLFRICVVLSSLLYTGPRSDLFGWYFTTEIIYAILGTTLLIGVFLVTFF